MTLAVLRERREVAIVVIQRVVIGLRDVDQPAAGVAILIRYVHRDRRAQLLQIAQALLPRQRDHVLGLGDLAVHELQSEAELRRLAVGLQHHHAADFLRIRIGDDDLELRRTGGRRLPQAFAGLDALRVLDDPDVGSQLHLARIVGDQRGQVVVGQRIQTSAVASRHGGCLGSALGDVLGDGAGQHHSPEQQHAVPDHGSPLRSCCCNRWDLSSLIWAPFGAGCAAGHATPTVRMRRGSGTDSSPTIECRAGLQFRQR